MRRKPQTPEDLFEENRALVHHIAQRVKIPLEEREDMIQEGYLALWRAANGYDENSGSKFSTYAGVAITRAMTNYAEKSWHRNHLSADAQTHKRAYKASQGEGKMKKGYERLIQDFVSLDAPAFRDEETTVADLYVVEDDYTPIYTSTIRDEIELALMMLPMRKRDIAARYFGYFDYEPKTISEIAVEYDVNYSYISAELREAKRLLAEMLDEYRDII